MAESGSNSGKPSIVVSNSRESKPNTFLHNNKDKFHAECFVGIKTLEAVDNNR